MSIFDSLNPFEVIKDIYSAVDSRRAEDRQYRFLVDSRAHKYKYERQSLEEAGYNPLLALNGNVSAPSPPSAGGYQMRGNWGTSALEARMMRENVERTKKDILLAQKAIEEKDQLIQNEKTNQRYQEKQIWLTQKEAEKRDSEIMLNKSFMQTQSVQRAELLAQIREAVARTDDYVQSAKSKRLQNDALKIDNFIKLSGMKANVQSEKQRYQDLKEMEKFNSNPFSRWLRTGMQYFDLSGGTMSSYGKQLKKSPNSKQIKFMK